MIHQPAPDTRGRILLVVRSVARSLAIVVVVLAVYFAVPIGDERGAWSLVVGAVVSLAGFGYLFAYQLRSIRTAAYPMVRAVEGLVSIAVIYLVATSAAHVALSLQNPQAYSEPLSRLDAVYFTVTMLTTVGFGDITAVTAVARSFTTVQMVLGVLLVTGVVRLLMWVARTERDRRSSEAA